MPASIRILAGLLLAAFFAGLELALLRAGLYGWTVFIICPWLLGGLAAWLFRARTGAQAAGIGALATTAGICSLLLLGAEGLICIAMAIPLVTPLGAIGGWMAFRALHFKFRARGAAAMLLLLPPAGIGVDLNGRAPIYAVRTAMEISAPPERVWQHVITFSELPEPADWFFRAGVAYPIRARIDGHGVGAVRYCEFSTGPFVEPIEVWDEPRLLRFRVTHNPAPLRELSPYGELNTRHLTGYLASEHGQFLLTPLPGRRTLLEGTTWYRHGLWPAAYWRLWSDAIIHRIHLRVLSHIRSLAETGAPPLVAGEPARSSAEHFPD